MLYARHRRAPRHACRPLLAPSPALALLPPPPPPPPLTLSLTPRGTADHCSLTCANKTTSEEIKETYGADNPFDVGMCRNCNEACCEEREPPRLRPRALLSEPERLDTCGLIDASLRDASSHYEPSASPSSQATADGERQEDGTPEGEGDKVAEAAPRSVSPPPMYVSTRAMPSDHMRVVPSDCSVNSVNNV